MTFHILARTIGKKPRLIPVELRSAVQIGPFVVHRSGRVLDNGTYFVSGNSRWRVTHAPTGLAMGIDARTRAIATSASRELLTLPVPWESTYLRHITDAMLDSRLAYDAIRAAARA